MKRNWDAIFGFFIGVATTVVVYAIYAAIKMIEGLTYKPPTNL